MSNVDLLAETTRVEVQDLLDQFYSWIKVAGTERKIILILRKIYKLYTKVFQNELMVVKEKEVVREFEAEPEDNRFWFRTKYIEVKKNLIQCFGNKNKSVKELALIISMKLLKLEVKYPFRKVVFPKDTFRGIIEEILSKDHDMKIITNKFSEFVIYDDIKLNLLQELTSKMKSEKDKSQLNYTYLQNFLELLSKIKLTKDEDETEEEYEPNNFCLDVKHKNNYESCKKLFNYLWMEFLKIQLNPSLYKKVLIILHDQVLPHLSNPLLLTDFLMDSYNSGGVVSLLALSSLFALIQNYNLEYPDFYKKLYSLVTPEILHAKYRARFFYLMDLFLSSTHLPEYLVAAFIKRLSRISLTAQPNTIIVLIPFIRNLICRHSNLSILTHNPIGQEMENDPFIAEESDPSKCKALESSLWEIESLQFHYVPEVVNAAHTLIRKQELQMEVDISDKYETTVNEMIEKECTKKSSEISVTYKRPTSIFSQEKNKKNNLWI